MNKQKGLTLTGMIIVSIIIILVLLLGFKVLPAYLEYTTVQKIFRSMAEDPALRGAKRADLERSWAMRGSVENVQSLDGGLIDYSKEGDTWVVSAEYSVKIPLVRNVAACIDFKPTSKQ